MSTIRIGICDDMPEAVEQIRETIEIYLIKTETKAELYAFFCGRDVLEWEGTLDILFLDVEMPDMDGFMVGKELQRKNPGCKIIMATGKTERFKEAFRINAFRFVSKPFDKNEILEALSDAVVTMVGQEMITLYEKRTAYEVSQREIILISAYGSFVEVWLSDRKMRRDDSLKTIMEELDSRMFYQIDRKHVINMLYIESYQDGEIVAGKWKLKVSRRRSKEFEAIYRKFDVTYGG